MYKCEKCKLDFKGRNGLNSHKSRCYLTPEDVEQIKKDYIENELSIRDIRKKYKISNVITHTIIGKENMRSHSEARVIRERDKARKPMSDETKQKIREARLKYMKENPEKTVWRQSNMSYPEKLFLNKLTELSLDKKYLIIRERSVFPYYIDFAFENEKIAIEIDGSQHEEEDRKNKDIEKDKTLNEKGWIVLRFSASKINIEVSECMNIVLEHLKNKKCNTTYDFQGVFLYKEIRNTRVVADKFKKCECGKIIEKKAKLCHVCHSITQRKVDRPTYEQLSNDIALLGYKGAGKKYGVSDNTAKKWKKQYEKK